MLLLRPTESVTVFLQQIGRGLRRAPDKQGLTILDFIGQQRREFRFGPRFEVLTHSPRGEVLRHVEEDFPRLPAGCSIWLEAKAKEVVLGNIRDALKVGRAGLARELASLGDMPLAEFLQRTSHELEDVYAAGRWPHCVGRRALPSMRAQTSSDSVAPSVACGTSRTPPESIATGIGWKLKNPRGLRRSRNTIVACS